MLPNEFKLYYTSSQVASHNAALTVKTVGAGPNTKTSFTYVGLVTGEWSYVMGWFDESASSPELRGHFFSIRQLFGLVITPELSLPVAPTEGDTFRIMYGAHYRSNQVIPINTVNTKVPSVSTVTLREITGVTILQCNSEVDLYVRYDTSSSALLLSIDGSIWGTALEFSGDVSDGYIQTPTGEWISVDITFASLPSDSTDEKILVGDLWGTIVPVMWVDSGNQNDVIHHFAVVENESVDTKNINVYSNETIGTALLGAEYTDGENTITLSNVSGLPGRDFWLYLDESVPDIRYVIKRAGNVCYLGDTSGWQAVTFWSGQTTEPVMSMVIECGGFSGVLRAIELRLSDWPSGNGVGTMILSDCDGLFPNGQWITQGGQDIALCTLGTWTIRSVNRLSSWPLGGSVKWYPSFDIAHITPLAGNEFQAITSAMSTVYNPYPLSWYWAFFNNRWLGAWFNSMAPNDVMMLAFRQYLINDIQGNLQIMNTLEFNWE